MNAGEMTQYFIDSNIWLYRFIVNTNDASSIKKQQIANPENPKILEILIQTNSYPENPKILEILIQTNSHPGYPDSDN
ncbi:hypothetical protein [Aphanizomenon sp. UHCC 0183]|uniref:hypothetical protein n=1 Tax=Aphanizomenon sp. UHCC 0183 TaxID=2590028 RepID=UPI001C2BC45E|nr:hypothetical protein [Aphanizomenon sp. UHCC 0183]